MQDRDGQPHFGPKISFRRMMEGAVEHGDLVPALGVGVGDDGLRDLPQGPEHEAAFVAARMWCVRWMVVHAQQLGMA